MVPLDALRNKDLVFPLYFVKIQILLETKLSKMQDDMSDTTPKALGVLNKGN